LKQRDVSRLIENVVHYTWLTYDPNQHQQLFVYHAIILYSFLLFIGKQISRFLCMFNFVLAFLNAWLGADMYVAHINRLQVHSLDNTLNSKLWGIWRDFEGIYIKTGWLWFLMISINDVLIPQGKLLCYTCAIFCIFELMVWWIRTIVEVLL